MFFNFQKSYIFFVFKRLSLQINVVLINILILDVSFTDAENVEVGLTAAISPTIADSVFRLVNVYGDGRCFFRCVTADGLSCLQTAARSEDGVLIDDDKRRLELVFADQIRDSVVKFLLSHSDMLHSQALLLPMLLDRGIGQSYSSVLNRIQRMSKVDEYAGFLEIVALSFILQRQIHIYKMSEELNKFTLIAKLPSTLYEKERPICIVHHFDTRTKPGHFNLLVAGGSVSHDDLMTQDMFEQRVKNRQQIADGPVFQDLLSFSSDSLVLTSSLSATDNTVPRMSTVANSSIAAIVEQSNVSKSKGKRRYENSFCDKWSTTYSFIKPSRLGEHYAFCEYCRADISISHGAMNDLVKHVNSNKHIRYAKAVTMCPSISNKFRESTSMKNSTIKAEALMVGFLVEHNLPIASSDHLSKLAHRMFPDSKIAGSLACGRTKSTHILQTIATESVKEATSTIAITVPAKEQHDVLSPWFSLATDGSSDVDDKYFPVLVTHWHTSGEVVTSFVDMPIVNQADAANITDACLKSLRKVKVDINRCVAFSSDNASVMIGKNAGMLALLQRERKYIYGMGCMCHLSSLAAKAGRKALKSFDFEEFLIDLYYHFHQSCKRKDELRDAIEFCETDIRKVLKHVETRWLSLGKCIDRALRLWPGLKSYYLTHFDDDDDDTTDDYSAHPKRVRKSKKVIAAREKRLVKVFKDPMSLVYCMFISAVITKFDHFNLLLQREEPMIHKVHLSAMTLYRDLLCCLIKPEVIQQYSHNVLDLPFDDPSVHRSHSDLFIGFAASQELRKTELDNSTEGIKFKDEAIAFYIKALQYIKSKFPLKDPVLKTARFMDPTNKLSVSFAEVENLIQYFPDVISGSEQINVLFSQYTDYQTAHDLPIDSEQRIDTFWFKLSLMRNPANEQKRFNELCNLAMYLLLIPHSNSFCESLFSMVNKNVSDSRSSLGKSKEGCGSTSVYAETTGVRNILCALLATKINVFKHTTCLTWTPSVELLRKAKHATHQALNDRQKVKL